MPAGRPGVRRRLDDGSDPDGPGTRLAVSEGRVVHEVFFRSLVRIVFGYPRTVDTYLVNLGKKFGEEVAPQ